MSDFSGIKVGVLAAQGGFAEHIAAVERCGAQARAVRKPEHCEDIDALIIPGGESTTISKLLEIGGLLEPIRNQISQGLPTFGTCAGMILLAHEVLDTRADAHQLDGLDITVRRNAFGRQIHSFETFLEVQGVDDPVHAVFIRAPWVEKVSEGVQVLSTVVDPEGREAIVAVRQGSVMATSFHPELANDDSIHKYFLRELVQPHVAHS